MKILATILAYSAALVAVNAISIAAYETPESNLISENADEYGADIEGYVGLSIIFQEKMLKSCKPAVAKLQSCAAKAAGNDPKWQQSIMTTGSTARGCLSKAKHQRQRDACVKPFIKLLETKCSKETKKMIDNECKVYSEEFDINNFELIMEEGFDEDSNFKEGSDEEGVWNVDENSFMTLQCKTELMQLQQCVNQTSKKDKTFRSTVETAASVERICLQTTVKKSDKMACTTQLKVILKSTCPKETQRVLRVCNIKTGELRATSLR
eukprot:scaffold12924_cov82-Skeletonema_dohrnii-CCMP3373.AAC.1